MLKKHFFENIELAKILISELERKRGNNIHVVKKKYSNLTIEIISFLLEI